MFIKLITIPAIKNTEIYGRQDVKSAFVLYPIKANAANISDDIPNKYIIESN